MKLIDGAPTFLTAIFLHVWWQSINIYSLERVLFLRLSCSQIRSLDVDCVNAILRRLY